MGILDWLMSDNNCPGGNCAGQPLSRTNPEADRRIKQHMTTTGCPALTGRVGLWSIHCDSCGNSI